MWEKIDKKNLNILNKIKNKEKLIISVSGGIDSVSMLHMLSNMGYNLVCVHFNHKKRLESDEEQFFVKNLCKKYKIPFYLYEVKINEMENFQSAARNFRYEKLKEVAKREKTKYIITAHHLDDLLETIIIKFIRGSNIYGYSGISSVVKDGSFIFLRPLLNITKAEIINYAKVNNIEYRTDKSNFSKDYLRNKIRLDLIPKLKQENPNILNNAISYSNQLKMAYNFIRDNAKSFLKNKTIVNIKDFQKQDLAVRYEILAILLSKKNIIKSYQMITDLLDIIKSKKPNLTYDLNKYYIFIKDYESFKIKKKVIKKEQKEIVLKENDESQIITYYKKLVKTNKPNGVINYKENDIKFPLIIRGKKNGDMLYFHYGSKKLSRFLIDKKISKEKRDNINLVVDSNNKILWIPKLYLNQNLKGDKIIHLVYNRGNTKKEKEVEDI